MFSGFSSWSKCSANYVFSNSTNTFSCAVNAFMVGTLGLAQCAINRSAIAGGMPPAGCANGRVYIALEDATLGAGKFAGKSDVLMKISSATFHALIVWMSTAKRSFHSCDRIVQYSQTRFENSHDLNGCLAPPASSSSKSQHEAAMAFAAIENQMHTIESIENSIVRCSNLSLPLKFLIYYCFRLGLRLWPLWASYLRFLYQGTIVRFLIEELGEPQHLLKLMFLAIVGLGSWIEWKQGCWHQQRHP